ncbi:MAG: oligosaccharide flippase family protein, partial [Clostridia bacterium]|nr:oligosaccharide flippase family protein [Clostridia bacterium]
YRIPLTNIIGAEGIGLYQMVFPVYCALLTFSSSGLPAAISKLIANGEDKGYLRKSLLLFGGLGLLGSALMCVLGGFLAKLQGNPRATLCYAALSPSVFAVSIISCFRGYFQGRNNMSPTALSQIIEQVVKTGFGIIVCARFSYSAELAAAAASLAVTVSEFFALLYLFARFYFTRGKVARSEGGARYGEILRLTFPATLVAVALPLGHLADSFIVINALGEAERATALFGVYSGSVAAIIGVPIALAYGAAVASVPFVSRGENDKIADSMRFTALISIPFSIFFVLFAEESFNLLYGGMGVAERFTGARILALDSFSVVTLSFLQTTNALLLALGKQRISVISMGAGLTIRAALCLLLCRFSGIGVLGAVIAANISYVFSLSLNLRFCLKRSLVPHVLKDAAAYLIFAFLCVSAARAVYFAAPTVAVFLISSALSAAAYLALAYLFGALQGRETSVFPGLSGALKPKN